MVHEVIRNGFLDTHLPTIRARYKAQRDAMRAALDKHLPAGCRFNVPAGGMFFWVELPEGLDAMALLPQAVDAGMAYVPGAPFYCQRAAPNTLRLSFVTVAPPLIEQGVAALGRVLARRAGGSAMKRRFDQLDVFTAEALRGNPLAVVHDAAGPGRRAHGGLRALDQPVRDHLPAAAHRRGGRLPRAHLHARRRAALCRPPHAGQLPRLAGGRRPAARRPAWWCSNAASAW